MQDQGVLDPCAKKIVQKRGTPFVEKFTSYRSKFTFEQNKGDRFILWTPPNEEAI
jgi:hypothetical protein